MQVVHRWILLVVCLPIAAGCQRTASSRSAVPNVPADEPGLWSVYFEGLEGAKYIDLTHTLTPQIPVWSGFGPARFGATVNPETGVPYIYEKDGFEATRYVLATDQYGTQLDPPAHWAPEYPTIDELPPTYALRLLVVISIVDQVAKDPGYQMQASDIGVWDREVEVGCRSRAG